MNPSLSWFAWTGNKIKQGDDVKCHELCSDYNFYWTYFPCVYIYSHLSKNTIRFWIETCQNNLNLHCCAVRVMGNSVSQLFTGLIWWVGCFTVSSRRTSTFFDLWCCVLRVTVVKTSTKLHALSLQLQVQKWSLNVWHLLF